MKKQKILYSINVEDVMGISEQEGVSVTEKDLSVIKEKIGDYFEDKWQGAIEYALGELKEK